MWYTIRELIKISSRLDHTKDNYIMLTYEYYRENAEEFKKYKGKDLVPFDCAECKERYCVVQRNCRRLFYSDHKNNYCSIECRKKAATTSVTVPCGNCKKPVTRVLNAYKAAKRHVFCDHSCAATYNNTHKTTGNRRSKLEAFLEEQLGIIYPNLVIIANGKEAIESELDFYFPELRFAIELNGIFHYEPIYGQHKLEQIRNNDNQKMIRCYERGIELMVLNVSDYKKFNTSSAQKYLEIVKDQLDSIMQRKEAVQTI